MATLIHEDGRTETITPAKGKKITLEEAYKAVNTDIVQMIPCRMDGKKRKMLIDEEGKLKPGQKLNAKATAMTREFLPVDDVIVGKVLVVEPGEGW